MNIIVPNKTEIIIYGGEIKIIRYVLWDGATIGDLLIDQDATKKITMYRDIPVDIDLINEAFSEMEIILDKLTQ